VPEAGYSATPLVRKLGIKEHGRVVLVGGPTGWTVPGLPDGARIARRSDPGSRSADVVIAFFRQLRRLEGALPGLGDAVFPDGALWTAWPRRAGGHQSDITESAIRAAALPLGLVDVKVAALDEDWSGLKLVWRKERRR
jgi:hypothetical protein